MKTRLILLIFTITGLIVWGCGTDRLPISGIVVWGSDEDKDPPSLTGALAITEVSGNAQEGRTGMALSAPLVVLVTSDLGVPVANQRVDFLITQGEARLSVQSAISDSRGQASTRLILGDQAGEIHVQARLLGHDSMVEFAATATTPSSGEIPLAGLVSWWPAEGNANDRGPAENHGRAVGAVGFVDGPIGQAFHFDGSSYIESPAIGMPEGDAARTVALWGYIEDIVAEEAIFAGYGEFGTTGSAFLLGANVVSETLSIFFSQWNSGIGCSACPDAFEMDLGQWYHVSVTSIGGNTTLYINGVSVKSRDLEVDTPALTPFFIGKLPGSVGDRRRLKGAVDEVFVYDRVLSDEEIRQLFYYLP